MAQVCQLCRGKTQQRYKGLCSPLCQALLSLPVYYWCASSCHPSAGAQREPVWVVESMCGFPKRNCLGFQQPPPPTQSPLLFAARSCADLPSWHWNLGLRGLVWVWDSSILRYPSQIFIHMGVGPARAMSAPLLPDWKDVVSSILWLSDFHSTQFLMLLSDGCSIF